ncbi:MAG: apolipoprotein N-acyltransferase, partial [Bacteroidia bacterium]
EFLGYAVLSGFLFWLGWPPHAVPISLFFALIPLFILEKRLMAVDRGSAFFGYLYLGLLIANVSTTWWVWNASNGGAVFMALANSFLMSIPFLFYKFTKKVVGQQKALMAFVFYWLAFEYFHFNWPVSYPWLTLGHGFAASPNLVQWYEYTGVLGGSLYILLANVLIFNLFRDKSRSKSAVAALWLLVPLMWSWYLGSRQDGCKKTKFEVLVIQPNIDPYEKFNYGAGLGQMEKFIELAERNITEQTQLVILPETAVVENVNEEELPRNRSLRMLASFSRKHNVPILTGAATYQFHRGPEETWPSWHRKTPEGSIYSSYNTALLIDSTGVVELYHKSRLVPGVESLPFPAFFKFFDKILHLDFGGMSGQLGSSPKAMSFPINHSTSKSIAPLICYESIYGEYVKDFVNDGATMMAVITNDGWWGNTPGHVQHMHYARLRAIEFRRYVVRSANTGISCVIDDNGRVSHQTKYWEEAAFTAKINPLNYVTYYSQHGDYLGRIASFLGIFMILGAAVRNKTKKGY